VQVDATASGAGGPSYRQGPKPKFLGFEATQDAARSRARRSAGPGRVVKLPEPVLQAMELERSGSREPAHRSL